MSLMVSVSGIRGIVGETMTPKIAGEFAAALGTHLAGGKVVVGRDSRLSGSELRDATVEQLSRCGCEVIDLGVVSTPGVALMVREHHAAGGLVITASHNPVQWNGLKFLTSQGSAPLTSQAEKIWALRENKSFSLVDDAGRGRVIEDASTHEKHVAAVLEIVESEAITARKFKIVLDSVNGAGGAAGLMLLQALGCEVTHMNAEPTGLFTHPPEPTADNLSDLCDVVRREGADVGFAQDPDADRLAIVDDNGTYIGEEYTIALAAKHMFGRHPGPAAVNLSTSRMIDDLASRAGSNCIVHRTAVGEANVVESIRRNDCVIGGEGNGGVIDPRVVAVRDSLVAMALTLQLLVDEKQPLSGIVATIPRYTMIKQKFECARADVDRALQMLKDSFAGERINDLDGVRIDLPQGWVHIRASNTEPIVRVIAEAKDKPSAEELVGRTREIIDRALDR